VYGKVYNTIFVIYVMMVEEAIIRLRRNGVLTIPIEIRKKLGLEKGDFLQIDIEGEEFTIKKVRLQS